MAIGSSTGHDGQSRLRIAIFGGTFDPIHIGHLVIAEEARVCLGLHRVIFVPARKPPHKVEEPNASAEERLEMVRLAIADNPYFCLSRVDLDREGPSFTVDTLRAMRADYPQAELFFLMGADSLIHLRTWHDPQGILRLARILAVSRPGFPLDLDALDARLPGLAAATDVLTTVRLDISSTDLRARVREGRPIRYQVPDAVEAFIRARGLYK